MRMVQRYLVQLLVSYPVSIQKKLIPLIDVVESLMHRMHRDEFVFSWESRILVGTSPNHRVPAVERCDWGCHAKTVAMLRNHLCGIFLYNTANAKFKIW